MDDKINTNITIPVGLEEFRFGDIRIWLPTEGTQEAWNKKKECWTYTWELKNKTDFPFLLINYPKYYILVKIKHFSVLNVHFSK